MEKQLSFPFWSSCVNRLSSKTLMDKFNKIAEQEEFDLSEEEIGEMVDDYEQKGFLM